MHYVTFLKYTTNNILTKIKDRFRIVVQTKTVGINGYILNPTDKAMIDVVYAGQALLGSDRYCNILKLLEKDFMNSSLEYR